QFPITDASAKLFASAFYGALADGYPVDAALAEARQSMDGGRDSDVEWITPVLYLHSRNTQLFDLPPMTEKIREWQTEERHRAQRSERLELIRRARTETAASDWPVAESDWKEVARLDPDLLEAKIGLRRAQIGPQLPALYASAEAHSAERRWRRALEDLDEVIACYGPYKDAFRLHADALRQLQHRSPPPESLDSDLSDTVTALRDGNLVPFLG